MSDNHDKPSLFRRIASFYIDGFHSMTIGRTLWAIILLKLAVLFLVMRLFFFPDILSRDYDNDEERAAAVRHNLTPREALPPLINL